MSYYKSSLSITDMVKMSDILIEKNENILKYGDMTLYDHQKELYTICKTNSKLISYIAPTGTGKTLSPLGLSMNHRVIFVCAARHVGLALAKAAISIEKRLHLRLGVIQQTIYDYIIMQPITSETSVVDKLQRLTIL